MVIKLGAGKRTAGQIGRNFVWSPEAKANFELELSRANRTKRRVKTPFSVFEVGSGSLPIALLRKVRRTNGARKNRRFTGVDNELNLNKFLRKTDQKARTIFSYWGKKT